jgi:hypothetical protein
MLLLRLRSGAFIHPVLVSERPDDVKTGKSRWVLASISHQTRHRYPHSSTGSPRFFGEPLQPAV